MLLYSPVSIVRAGCEETWGLKFVFWDKLANHRLLRKKRRPRSSKSRAPLVILLLSPLPGLDAHPGRPGADSSAREPNRANRMPACLDCARQQFDRQIGRNRSRLLLVVVDFHGRRPVNASVLVLAGRYQLGAAINRIARSNADCTFFERRKDFSSRCICRGTLHSIRARIRSSCRSHAPWVAQRR